MTFARRSVGAVTGFLSLSSHPQKASQRMIPKPAESRLHPLQTAHPLAAQDITDVWEFIAKVIRLRPVVFNARMRILTSAG
jgi:hypothetical protein